MQSPRLRRFEELLSTLNSQQADSSVLTKAWEQLEVLEIELGRAWDEHQAESSEMGISGTEELQGIEEGFLAWFDAFDLARVGEAMAALAAAARGDEAFRNVAVPLQQEGADGEGFGPE